MKLAAVAEYSENKTHWKDSSAQEGRPTVSGENHLWHEKLKPNETPPKLEEIYKDREKQGEDTPLTAEGEARCRRVLGQLAWAALSGADLCFSVSYLAIPVEAIRCSESLFACTVTLVVDAPSPRADHAFSGRIAKRGTAKRC